jgi:hypothetical protein
VSEHRLVPEFVLARFADGFGRVMAERRDRTRRVLLSVPEAAAQAGLYRLAGAGAPADLGGLVGRIEEGALRTVTQMTAGAFPPADEDRRCVALFLALALVLGRHYREGFTRAVALLAAHLDSRLEELADALDAPGEAEAPQPGPVSGPPSAPDRAEVVAGGAQPVTVPLSSVPRLAGLLSARTWQLLRVPERLLLMGDAPVVLWTRPSVAKPWQFGVDTADEVRVALDPQHALILARVAPAGEVVREVGERHARALNRTLAEAAGTWMYYHPESDPLEGVEVGAP